MTDRFRRARRRQRRTRRVIFLVAAIFFWRFLGPGNGLIDTSTLSPLLEQGDVVFLRPVRSLPSRHTVLLTPPPLSDGTLAQEFRKAVDLIRRTEDNRRPQPSRVPRIVIAREDDQVTWDDRTITVRSEGGVETYRLAPLHEDLTFPVRQTRLQNGELFLLSIQPGRIDSRFTGPVTLESRSFRVERIIWPLDRRNRITTDEVRKSL